LIRGGHLGNQWHTFLGSGQVINWPIEVRIVEYPMSIQVKKVHPALKHAGYAATALLPGEIRLTSSNCIGIAELKPKRQLEDPARDAVAEGRDQFNSRVSTGIEVHFRVKAQSASCGISVLDDSQ
jgi:hypothetical protein